MFEESQTEIIFDEATHTIEAMIMVALRHIEVFNNAGMPKTERFLLVLQENKINLNAGVIRLANGFLNF